MQAGLGVDHDLLGRDQPVELEGRVDRHVALEQRERDRAQLVVAARRADPAAQGGGLGKLLTLAGLHHLAATGHTEVLLYVESDNAPAVRVYSGLGFTHAPADTHVQYRRAPTPSQQK